MPTPKDNLNTNADIDAADVGAANAAGRAAADRAGVRPSPTDVSLLVAHAANPAKTPAGRAIATMHSPDNVLATVLAAARAAEPSDDRLPETRLPPRAHGADRVEAQGLGRTIEAVATAADSSDARVDEAGRTHEPVQPKGGCGCQPKAVLESPQEPSEQHTALMRAVERETYRVLLSGELLLGGVTIPRFDIPITRPDLLFQVGQSGPQTIEEQLLSGTEGQEPGVLVLDSLPDPRQPDPPVGEPKITRWLKVDIPPVIESYTLSGPYGQRCLEDIANTSQGMLLRRFFAAIWLGNFGNWPNYDGFDEMIESIIKAFCCCRKGMLEDNPYTSSFHRGWDRLERRLNWVLKPPPDRLGQHGRNLLELTRDPRSTEGILRNWAKDADMQSIVDECCGAEVPTQFNAAYPHESDPGKDLWGWPFERDNGGYRLLPIKPVPTNWTGATWCDCDCDLVIGWSRKQAQTTVSYDEMLTDPPPAPPEIRDPWRRGATSIPNPGSWDQIRVLEVAWRCNFTGTAEQKKQAVRQAFLGQSGRIECVFHLLVEDMRAADPDAKYPIGREGVDYPDAAGGAGRFGGVQPGQVTDPVTYGTRIAIRRGRKYRIEITVQCPPPNKTQTKYELFIEP